MRGRYLMREYWEDSDLWLRLSAEEREFYIGLWMLADDAGWLPRDVAGIAAALYRYENRHERETTTAERLTKLRELGKIESLRCCVFVPAVPRYPRPGNKSQTHLAEHQRHSAKNKRVQKGSNPTLPDRTSPDPTVAPARPPDGGAVADLLAERDREDQREMAALVARGKVSPLRGRRSA